MELGSKLKSMQEGLEKGADVALVWPGTNRQIGITIRVASADSDRARTYLRQQANDQMRNPAHRMTAEESESRARAFLVALVIDWTWGSLPNPETGEPEPITIEGKQWEFSPQNVEQFFRRFPEFIPQVDRATSDVSRFYAA